MTNARDVAEVVTALLTRQCYSVTRYLSPRMVIRATKPRYRHRKRQWRSDDSRIGLVVSIGVPNWRERNLISRRRAAKDSRGFPFTEHRDFPKPRR